MVIPNMFSLAGKKAIVTGAARGLGLEMSKALADAGADVAMMYVSSDKTHDTAAAVAKEFNVVCKAYKADMADTRQVVAAMKQIFQDFGQIDIFVANDAMANECDAETFAMEDWKRIVDANVYGVYCSAQFAGVYMLRRGKGSIILISSIAGAIGYGTSKRAFKVIAITPSGEQAARGIRVNSINPGYGYMMTKMLKDGAGNKPGLKEKWEEYIPMGRLGRPDSLNGTVVYLASDASSYVNGAHIYVDGDYTSV